MVSTMFVVTIILNNLIVSLPNVDGTFEESSDPEPNHQSVEE